MNIIVVTSAWEDDGKSTISKRIAKEKSEHGERVVIIDLDNIKSERLGIGVGVTEYLDGQCGVSECIVPEDNYSVFLPGFNKRCHHKLVMDRRKVIKLFKELSSDYDVAIIDTAPLTLYDESEKMGCFCDEFVFVNSGRDYSCLKRRLQSIKAPVVIVDNLYRNKTAEGC